MADYLPLGTRVTFQREHILERHTVREMAGYPKTEYIDGRWARKLNARDVTSRLVDRWMRGSDYEYRVLTEQNTGQMEGVICGVRTLASGFSAVENYYESIMGTFFPVDHHRVYQVAYSLYRKPALLFLDDVRPEVSRG